MGLIRTADEARRFFSRVLEREDLTFQQYNVLRILRGAGEEGLPTLEVGERMIQREPGVTRIVDRLERKGLACRRRGTEDRRRVICSITEEGLDTLARLDGPVDRADRELMRGLTREKQGRLVQLLDELRHALRSTDPEV